MGLKRRQFYTFGLFRIDPAERVLLSGNSRIPLTPKACDTLLVLVENAGHIVEKDEILKRVWPDTFVEEGTLAQNVSTLRKALGEGPTGATYIETIPKRGYCFVAAVSQTTEEDPPRETQVPGGPSPATAALPISQISVPTQPATIHAEPSASRMRSLSVWLVVIVLLCAISAAYLLRQRYLRAHQAPTTRATLAVLPFDNLSGDPQQQYFADGFTEEMISQLGDLDPTRLAVIARVSAMQYQHAGKSARDIGRELGADYLLRGSITRDGENVRITAQLIHSSDQTTLWAKDYDRGVRDILSLQSDVAGAIAAEIKLKLTPQESARLAGAPPIDPDAYELYLKGRYFWNKRSEVAYGKAIEYFNEAITRDPQYARAYSGLADAYALLGSWPNAAVPRRIAMPRAKQAALTALKLDDSLAEAHASLAFVEMQYEWNWQASEQEFRRAIELNPNYATAHQWFAYWLMAQGRSDESIAENNRARKADPLSIIIRTDAADLLCSAGRFDEAIEKAREAMELDPNFRLTYYFLGLAYTGKQMYPEAIAEYQKGIALDENDEWARSGLGRTFAIAGDRAAATKILKQLLQDSRQRGDLSLEIAYIYSELHDRDQAFVWLEKAFQDREGGLLFLNTPLYFQPIRSDPRFADMVRPIGLPQEMTVATQGAIRSRTPSAESVGN
jgi:TolB-like protein/DNA-binding winged helix-turn-helix (wHTH) protein/Tfp pilus assembly protein PilF